MSKQITDSEGKFYLEDMSGGLDSNIDFSCGILDFSVYSDCDGGGNAELTLFETKKLYERMKEYYEKDLKDKE
jgi:hypothetical protein